jgi:hypothetical protein
MTIKCLVGAGNDLKGVKTFFLFTIEDRSMGWSKSHLYNYEWPGFNVRHLSKSSLHVQIFDAEALAEAVFRRYFLINYCNYYIELAHPYFK